MSGVQSESLTRSTMGGGLRAAATVGEEAREEVWNEVWMGTWGKLWTGTRGGLWSGDVLWMGTMEVWMGTMEEWIGEVGGWRGGRLRVDGVEEAEESLGLVMGLMLSPMLLRPS